MEYRKGVLNIHLVGIVAAFSKLHDETFDVDFSETVLMSDELEVLDRGNSDTPLEVELMLLLLWIPQRRVVGEAVELVLIAGADAVHH